MLLELAFEELTKEFPEFDLKLVRHNSTIISDYNGLDLSINTIKQSKMDHFILRRKYPDGSYWALGLHSIDELRTYLNRFRNCFTQMWFEIDKLDLSFGFTNPEQSAIKKHCS